MTSFSASTGKKSGSPARRSTRRVKAAGLAIGGDSPVSVQTMWKEPLVPEGVPAVVVAIDRLRRMGCDLVRFAVPDLESADLLGMIAASASLPLVADIHFDYRIALRCMDHPIAKVRINPGNIGEEWKVREVVAKARDRGIVLRIGVNEGSLPRNLEKVKNRPLAMVRAAQSEMAILEKLDFRDVVFSLKSSDLDTTVKANALFSRTYDYPLHIGITEAGPSVPGIVRNTLGIATLLRKGIGDTIRVSLSASPDEEVQAGVELLRALHARSTGVQIVSCPTCGRTSFDVKKFLEQVSFRIQQIEKPLRIAVMGCAVNGPGEARHADLGITGAGKLALIFRGDHVIRRVAFEEAAAAFMEEMEKLCAQE